MLSYGRQTCLDCMAANQPGLPHVPAPEPRSPRRLSPDALGLWSCRPVPGTQHIFGQNQGVVLGDCLGWLLRIQKRVLML